MPGLVLESNRFLVRYPASALRVARADPHNPRIFIP
jgi:hypothetical protein